MAMEDSMFYEHIHTRHVSLFSHVDEVYDMFVFGTSFNLFKRSFFLLGILCIVPHDQYKYDIITVIESFPKNNIQIYIHTIYCNKD